MGSDMGLETVLLIAGTLGKAHMQASAAEAQAKQAVREGELEAQERAKRTRAKAGAQKTSFLSSGLTLEGTPMSAIQATFKTGLEDVDLVLSNADRRAKNAHRAGRSQVIGTLASGARSFAGGGFETGGGGQLDLSGDLKGINVPFTGTAHSTGVDQFGNVAPIPGSKPTRINF